MADTNINHTTSLTVDRQAPYAVQHEATADSLMSLLASKRTKVTLAVTFGSNGIPEWTFAGPSPKEAKHLITYTRAEILGHLKTLDATIRTMSIGAYSDKVPTYVSTAKQWADALDHLYTVTKGKNEGQVRCLVLHAAGATRRKIKYEAARILREDAVENGDAFYAEGIVDKDGNPRAYATRNQAEKAWVRSPMLNKDDEETLVESERVSGGFGPNWYVDRSKAQKAALFALAPVYEQATTVGKTSHQDVNRYSLSMLDSMPAIKVCGLAKKAGAPAKVFKGTGAKARSIEWFASDVSRLTNLQ